MKISLSRTEADAIPDWTRSSRSGAAGHCVELAAYGDDIAMRNSNRPDAGAILFTRQEITAFLEGADNGDFDQYRA